MQVEARISMRSLFETFRVEIRLSVDGFDAQAARESALLFFEGDMSMKRHHLVQARGIVGAPAVLPTSQDIDSADSELVVLPKSPGAGQINSGDAGVVICKSELRERG